MSNNNFPNMAIDTSGVTKIVLSDEGVAGTSRLRLDHDVILGIDTWNLGQLNELLVIVPEGRRNWSAPQTNLGAEITSISAENPEQFLKSFAAESPNIQLDRSFGLLVLAENLSVQLSDLYALEALFIRDFNPAMRAAIGQTANRSIPIVKDIYFKAESPNYEFSVDLISEAVLDIFSGNLPNLGFVDNQRTFASSTEGSHTPAYPVPNALRRPTVPLNAILIEDFDIDHPFVDRAWYTVSNDEKSLEVFALNEFEDMDTFASVIDVTGTHRLQLQPSSALQDDLFVFHATTPWSGDSCRIEIHQKGSGESAPRSVRAEVVAKQSMAYVAARLQTVARTADFAQLIQADPTLDIDLDRCMLLFSQIAKRPDLALACQQIRRSFVNPQNNESLFSSWERCQSTEILRKLLSIGIDKDLPELAEINEQNQWDELRRTKKLVDSLNAQIQSPSGSSRGARGFQPVNALRSMSFKDLSTERQVVDNWVYNVAISSDSHATQSSWVTNLNLFEADSEQTTDLVAQRFALHTFALQSLAMNFVSRIKDTDGESKVATGMKSTRSSRHVTPMSNNFDLLINRLRIAQSSI
jgi:hypothetical protein